MVPNLLNNSQLKICFFTDHDEMESNFHCDKNDGEHFVKFVELLTMSLRGSPRVATRKCMFCWILKQFTAMTRSVFPGNTFSRKRHDHCNV